MPAFLTSSDVEVKLKGEGIVRDAYSAYVHLFEKTASYVMITGANTDCASNLHSFQVAA